MNAMVHQKKEINVGHQQVDFHFFLTFLCIHMIVWTIVPTLLYKSLPLDTLETIAWGTGDMTWGNSKHPPLSGWIAAFIERICGYQDFPFYLLSQLCSVLGIFCCYRVFRFFLSDNESKIAAIVQSLIFSYNFLAIEFNVNVITLFLWPLTTLFFLRTLQSSCIFDFIILGVLIGINILTKYSCVFLFCGFGLYLIVLHMKKTKRFNSFSFKTKRFIMGYFCTFILAILISLPHIIWLIQENFPSFSYIYNRIQNDSEGTNWSVQFFLRPFQLLLNVFFVLILPFIVLFFSQKNRMKFSFQKCLKEKSDAFIFSTCIFIAPLILLIMFNLIGMNVRTMWINFLCFSAGLFLFSLLFTDNEIDIARFRIILCLFSSLIIFGFTFVTLLKTSQRRNFPVCEIAKDLQSLYVSYTKHPLTYVIGDIFHAGFMHHYSPAHPIPCIYNNSMEVKRLKSKLQNNSYFVLSDAISDIKASVLNLESYEPEQENIQSREVHYSSFYGKEKQTTIYYFFSKK